MIGPFAQQLDAQSITTPGATARMSRRLDGIPAEIGGRPAYVCGLLVSYYGTLTGTQGTEDASQRALAESLGTVQVQGGGDSIAATALRGDELLNIQHLLGLNTAYAQAADYGVIRAESDVSSEGVDREHHVLIPYAPALFQPRPISSARPWDGARDSVLFRASSQIVLNQIGTAPVTDVAWSNITVKVTAIMCAADEQDLAHPLVPQDVRCYPHGTFQSQGDPAVFGFGDLVDIIGLGLLSDDVPATADAENLDLYTEDSTYELKVDGVTVVELQAGRLWPALWTAYGNQVALQYADEPLTVAPVLSPTAVAMASQRHRGSLLTFNGFSSHAEDVRLVSYTRRPHKLGLLREWARLRGYSLDRLTGPGLADRASVGVPAKAAQ